MSWNIQKPGDFINGPLTVTGAATITGNLTVDTNTLFVDSANDRVGIGTATPAAKLIVRDGANRNLLVASDATQLGSAGIAIGGFTDGAAGYAPLSLIASAMQFGISGSTAMTLNSTGLGVGVTPSAWGNNFKVVQVGQAGSVYGAAAFGYYGIKFNLYNDNTNDIAQTTNFVGEYRFEVLNGKHVWRNKSTAGTIGTNQTLTDAMTLDASGNLLVGITSGSYNRIKKDSTADAGNAIFELVGASNATSSIHYSVSSYNANAANAASKFGRDATTLRSINAGGTVNASGADYAEYMVKCSDFVLSKGDVSGIDANGKLTNVFSDAVSFVVKSTDPSYVGNDKWGVGLEGTDLESARQLVDRIAFAGQVPVNVTGAKAGDYIVPVVNGTGIKGQSVSNPTFKQYQLAVGKVISIDADGRARIIVKVA
jgi:hypothetical protein